jgi:hypothetical protein
LSPGPSMPPNVHGWFNAFSSAIQRGELPFEHQPRAHVHAETDANCRRGTLRLARSLCAQPCNDLPRRTITIRYSCVMSDFRRSSPGISAAYATPRARERIWASWPPNSSSHKIAGSETRSALTALHQPRSLGTHRTNPGGQTDSERRSATVSAVT